MKIVAKQILVASALAASMASHALTVNLIIDDADPTVIRPDSGTTIYNFTGTALVTGQSNAWSLSVFFPYLQGNNTDNLITMAHPDLIQGLNHIRGTDGGVYSGNLFSVQVQSTSDLGLYDHRFNSAELPEVRLAFYDPQGTTGNDIETFQVNVAPVPEPTTLVLLGSSLALAAITKRRKST